MWRFSIPRVKDHKYIDWIKTRPCAYCPKPGPSEPHHVRSVDPGAGVGRKPSDYLVLPACRRCHELAGARSSIVIPNENFEVNGILYHLQEYLQELKK